MVGNVTAPIAPAAISQDESIFLSDMMFVSLS